MKTDVENCRLRHLHPLCLHCQSVCIHHEANDLLNKSSVALQVSRVQASESKPRISTSVRISTKSTTNFVASRSTELTRSHHNFRNQWLPMQATDKDASRCTRSAASDAKNQSPEQVCKKRSCEKLVQHVFHVINVTLFGSRGTSSSNSLSSSLSRVSIPRLARFREDSNLGSCINFQRKARRTNSSPKVHVLHQSLLSQHHPAVPQNDSNVLLFHAQRDSV